MNMTTYLFMHNDAVVTVDAKGLSIGQEFGSRIDIFGTPEQILGIAQKITDYYKEMLDERDRQERQQILNAELEQAAGRLSA
jgi:hypothetical protein